MLHKPEKLVQASSSLQIFIEYVTYKETALFFCLVLQKNDDSFCITVGSHKEDVIHSSNLYTVQINTGWWSCFILVAWRSCGFWCLHVASNICDGGVAKVFRLIRLMGIFWLYEVLINNEQRVHSRSGSLFLKNMHNTCISQRLLMECRHRAYSQI